MFDDDIETIAEFGLEFNLAALSPVLAVVVVGVKICGVERSGRIGAQRFGLSSRPKTRCLPRNHSRFAAPIELRALPEICGRRTYCGRGGEAVGIWVDDCSSTRWCSSRRSNS